MCSESPSALGHKFLPVLGPVPKHSLDVVVFGWVAGDKATTPCPCKLMLSWVSSMFHSYTDLHSRGFPFLSSFPWNTWVFPALSTQAKLLSALLKWNMLPDVSPALEIQCGSSGLDIEIFPFNADPCVLGLTLSSKTKFYATFAVPLPSRWNHSLSFFCCRQSAALMNVILKF